MNHRPVEWQTSVKAFRQATQWLQSPVDGLLDELLALENQASLAVSLPLVEVSLYGSLAGVTELADVPPAVEADDSGEPQAISRRALEPLPRADFPRSAYSPAAPPVVSRGGKPTRTPDTPVFSFRRRPAPSAPSMRGNAAPGPVSRGLPREGPTVPGQVGRNAPGQSQDSDSTPLLGLPWGEYLKQEARQGRDSGKQARGQAGASRYPLAADPPLSGPPSSSPELGGGPSPRSRFSPDASGPPGRAFNLGRSSPIMNGMALIGRLADQLLAAPRDNAPAAPGERQSRQRLALPDAGNIFILPGQEPVLNQPYSPPNSYGGPSPDAIGSNGRWPDNPPASRSYPGQRQWGSAGEDVNPLATSFEPDELAALVNEALAEEARRHGVDLS